ncbi:hypothetical protein BGZ73_005879 [Actinomortierella ambigua]|nr:hypothetical protein BGZ73_005879 [Actinomortierella ambigua]
MSLVSKPAPAKNNRRLGAVVAYTTLACSLVSIGVYMYRQQKKQRSTNGDQSSAPGQSGSTRRRSDGTVDGPSTSTESTSSLSKLGSRIARTVKRNRKVMTISIKNTIVWNPSPDPTAPNYGFVEGVVPLLFHLAENYNLHLILLCPSSSQQDQQSSSNDNTNGKTRQPTIQEEESLKADEQLGRERDREQILTMLANVGLMTAVPSPSSSAASTDASGSKNTKNGEGRRRISFNNNASLIDPRRLLICETEEGISHIVRHLESQVHIDASQEVVELVQGVVPRVIYVDRRPSPAALAAAAAAQQQASNGRRISSSSTASSTSYSSKGDQDVMARSAMDSSFVEVSHRTNTPQKEPLVSGYVTQAGKKGYVEVVDSLTKSSLQPDAARRS